MILLLALRRVTAGTMTVGELVLVNTYLLQLTRPMERLGQLYRSIKQAFVDLEQLLELLAEEPEVADRPDAVPLPTGPGAVRVRARRRSPTIRAGRSCATSIFACRPASALALVGPTGAGKSTIAPPAVPLLRPDGGPHPDRRRTTCATSPRPACAPPSPSCRRTPCCSTIRSATIWPSAGPTRPRAEIEAAAAGRRAPRLHRRPARRLRHAGRRARPQAVRRREAARGDRPRHPQAAAPDHPRRGDLGAGQRHRAADPGAACVRSAAASPPW